MCLSHFCLFGFGKGRLESSGSFAVREKSVFGGSQEGSLSLKKVHGSLTLHLNTTQLNVSVTESIYSLV